MLKLPHEVVQAIHDYLVTKPMVEVEALVSAIRQAKPVDEQVATPKSSD